jgi:predicted amidophosphoribosyltransferase
MATLYLTLALLALFFIMMSVRLILLKNGEFKGTCASQNPYLNKSGETCSYCGKTVDQNSSCGNPDNEVDKVLAKFK